MNYAESIAYIEDKASLGIVPGLDNILDILQVLGNPEQRIPDRGITQSRWKFRRHFSQTIMDGSFSGNGER